MSVPESAHRLALQKPHETARFAIARHVEKIARRPLEFGGEGPPGIQEPASVIDRLTLFII